MRVTCAVGNREDGWTEQTKEKGKKRKKERKQIESKDRQAGRPRHDTIDCLLTADQPVKGPANESINQSMAMMMMMMQMMMTMQMMKT